MAVLFMSVNGLAQTFSSDGLIFNITSESDKTYEVGSGNSVSWTIPGLP